MTLTVRLGRRNSGASFLRETGPFYFTLYCCRSTELWLCKQWTLVGWFQEHLSFVVVFDMCASPVLSFYLPLKVSHAFVGYT